MLEYFISTHGARKGLADTALKTANSGYLTRRLVDVAQDVIVERASTAARSTASRSTSSSRAARSSSGSAIASSAASRSADITDPITGDVLVGANQEIDEDKVRKIEDAGVEHVTIRSVLTCNARRGVCARCYGRDLGQGKLVNLGEAVGVIAAQSIGEPGTQLTMRTFHIGGTATQRVEQSHVEARNEGVVKYLNLTTIRDKHRRSSWS